MANTDTSTVVWNRDHTQAGVLTGSIKTCQMESCRANRYAVRWPDGKLTWPCGKGLELLADGSQQIR